jgi:hypothetical protein
MTDAEQAIDFGDSPEVIARGQRYLAWTAGVTLFFVLAATVTVYVAHERKERTAYRQNKAPLAMAIGADMARQFPTGH